jgi:hypothetical protein
MSKSFEVLRPEGLLAGFYLGKDNGVEAGRSLMYIVSGLLSNRICCEFCAGGSRRGEDFRGCLLKNSPGIPQRGKGKSFKYQVTIFSIIRAFQSLQPFYFCLD